MGILPTVDGSEIRDQLTSWGNGSLSHDVQGFLDIPGGDHRISEPSTVPAPKRDLKHMYTSPENEQLNVDPWFQGPIFSEGNESSEPNCLFFKGYTLQGTYISPYRRHFWRCFSF